jgi:small subunit ribosomal protein S4
MSLAGFIIKKSTYKAMARYTGPKTKICRIFGEPILGNGKYLSKNSNPPGQHGANRKRKQLGEYAFSYVKNKKQIHLWCT